MVFEAIIFCVDNSPFMINGDVQPSRSLSQAEAVTKIATKKISESPETTVGLLSMAEGQAEVLIPSTRQAGEIAKALHLLPPGGSCELIRSIKVAQLVLKNRQNKNQKPRIIFFVGSPTEETAKNLQNQAKMLRKNSIALDVVLFGDESHSTETHKKFEEMVKCANSAENSRLIHVKAGSSVIKALEPIFFPSLIEETNPSQEENELAMALQMSLEESRKQHLSEKTATDSADEKKETKSHTTASLKQKQNEKEMKKKRPSSKSAEELAKDMASNLQAEEKVEPMTDDKEEMDKMLKDRDFVQELLDTLPEVEKAEIDVEKLINDVMKEHDEKKDEKKK